MTKWLDNLLLFEIKYLKIYITFFELLLTFLIELNYNFF